MGVKRPLRLVPIYFKSDGLNLRYFKLRLFELTKFMFEMSKVYDIGLQRYWGTKSEIVATTQFLFHFCTCLQGIRMRSSTREEHKTDV